MSENREQRSRELFSAWEAGDAKARDALITLHIDLVRRLAEKFSTKYKCDSDDLEDAAQLALVKAVDQLLRRRPDTITGYLSKSIKNAILRELQGKWKYARRHTTLDRVDEEPWYLDDSVEARETLEEILVVCESTRDRWIVKLRAEGCSLSEIGAAIGIGTSTVDYRLTRIEQAYCERHGIHTGAAPEAAQLARQRGTEAS